MKMNPSPLTGDKISVIIPTYNRKNMLERAINSVLYQDYQNIEIIVSDNASTDGTSLMMNVYCKKYSCIKYILREKNIGAHSNSYLAYKEHAIGEYLFFLSDDDYLMSTTFFSHAVEKFKQYPNLKIVTGIVLMEYVNRKQFITIPYTTRGYVRGYSFLIHMWTPHIYGKINEIISQFLIVRKRDVDSLEFFSWFQYGDIVLKYCLSFMGDIYFLREIIGCYHMHDGPRDATDIEKVQKEIINIAIFWEYMINLISQKYPNRIEFFKKHLAIKLYDNTIINMMDRIEERILIDRNKMFKESRLEQYYPYVYKVINSVFFIEDRYRLCTNPQIPGIKQCCKQIMISYKYLFLAILKKISRIVKY